MKRTSPSSSYVDPSSLSLPSPLSDNVDVDVDGEASSPQAPEAVSTPSTSAQPSRKRPRTDTSPEEKREARAHRNRIAAQNSRDRRKVQFTQLEERVQALQRENDQLRAELQQERERRDNAEKEKENAELKERVKSLEQAWEPVLKAFQNQGLPSSLFTPKSPSSSQSPDPKSDPPSTFPVFIESPPILPLTPLSIATSSSIGYSQAGLNDGSIRHLARVASAAVNSAASLQRMDPSNHRPCPPSTSMRRSSSRKRPSIALRTRRPITASNIGFLKCCQATGIAQQATPSQRRRLLAYLLLAMARNHNISNRNPPPPPPRV